MRMISASSSVPRPLVGKEPARGGEEVRLPDQGCRNPEGARVPPGHSQKQLSGTPFDNMAAFQERNCPESRNETHGLVISRI